MQIKPYERKAHFYETDQMGIIHHSNYIRWFEEARVDLLEQIGFPYQKVSAEGIDLAVLEVQCEYKSMVHFDDTVRIHAWIAQITAARMTVRYEVTDAKSGEQRTAGYSKHCFYDGRKKCPVRLNKAIPELYELLTSLHHPQTGA